MRDSYFYLAAWFCDSVKLVQADELVVEMFDNVAREHIFKR
jgi:hypothetical protein